MNMNMNINRKAVNNNNNNVDNNPILPPNNNNMPRQMAIARPRPNNPIWPPVQIPPPPEDDAAKMVWGAPTWTMLHVMATQVNSELFSGFREDLLNVIFTICTSLPCPSCAQHAKQYLTTMGFNNIRTKAQLEEFLFVFHNTVNVRKHRPVVTREEVGTKYQNVNFIQSVYNCMSKFQDGSAQNRYLAHELYRGRVIAKIKAWFAANQAKFI